MKEASPAAAAAVPHTWAANIVREMSVWNVCNMHWKHKHIWAYCVCTTTHIRHSVIRNIDANATKLTNGRTTKRPTDQPCERTTERTSKPNERKRIKRWIYRTHSICCRFAVCLCVYVSLSRCVSVCLYVCRGWPVKNQLKCRIYYILYARYFPLSNHHRHHHQHLIIVSRSRILSSLTQPAEHTLWQQHVKSDVVNFAKMNSWIHVCLFKFWTILMNTCTQTWGV